MNKMNINNVAIFGGNGTIGSAMCGLISGFGNAKVYLIARDKKKLDEKLLNRIFSSIKSDSIKDRIILCDYNDALNILKECDWIFESVSENFEIKKSVYEIIDKNAKSDAIISTGTSGLSINKLAEVFSENKRKYFLGTHFFNPPYHMNLCELIKTNYTDKKMLDEFKEYLENVLLRKTIISKDNPAFIANRIGFKVMNELLLLVHKYSEYGGINYIDSIFTGFTGRNMEPLKTIDFVGLDIHKAIVDNINNNTIDEFNDLFNTPEWFDKLISDGKIGAKVGEGLYKGRLVYDVNSQKYIDRQEFIFPALEQTKELIKDGKYVQAYNILLNGNTREQKIISEILTKYVVYSIYISSITAKNIEDCDDAMATGFGWCPPFALKNLMDEAYGFEKLCDKYIDKNILKKYNIKELINIKSKYDYKKYIKAL